MQYSNPPAWAHNLPPGVTPRMLDREADEHDEDYDDGLDENDR